MIKTYKGWEILKLIDEGELKEGQRVVSRHKGLIVQFIVENRSLTSEENSINGEWLSYAEFQIPKEYLTFDEARHSGKKFKYKSWGLYHNFEHALNYLSINYNPITINTMLDEQAWEVEV